MCPPFDYAHYLSSVPPITSSRWKFSDGLYRYRGITEEENRIWLWHRRALEFKGVSRKSFVLEARRFRRRLVIQRLEAGLDADGASVEDEQTAPREETKEERWHREA